MVQVDNKAPGDKVTCMILVFGYSTLKQKGTTGDWYKGRNQLL